MSSIETVQVSENTPETVGIANNMALVFADQVKKGIVPWHKVPLSLRPYVDSILNRGE